jgi:hypothetical protein
MNASHFFCLLCLSRFFLWACLAVIVMVILRATIRARLLDAQATLVVVITLGVLLWFYIEANSEIPSPVPFPSLDEMTQLSKPTPDPR